LIVGDDLVHDAVDGLLAGVSDSGGQHSRDLLLRLNRTGDLSTEPLQGDKVAERLGIPAPQLLETVRWLDSSGDVYAGAEAANAALSAAIGTKLPFSSTEFRVSNSCSTPYTGGSPRTVTASPERLHKLLMERCRLGAQCLIGVSVAAEQRRDGRRDLIATCGQHLVVGNAAAALASLIVEPIFAYWQRAPIRTVQYSSTLKFRGGRKG
jgi:hypothetical protein